MSFPIAATLTLSPDNPSNTIVYDADMKAAYIVYTEHAKSSVTHVKNADDEIIASLEWRDVLPDKVKLGKGEFVSIRDWLHTSLVPFYLKDDVPFKDDSGRKYKWRGNAPGRAFELFAEDDNYKEPIARFYRSRKDHASGTMTPATLALTARALQIRDTTVISFLFLEKTRRTNETTSQTYTDVMSVPVLSAVTGSDYNVRNGGV